MSAFGGYTTVNVGAITPTKLRKALDGNAVRLSNAELTGDRVMVVSKLNAKAIKKAQKSGKGLTTHFTAGEMARDLEHHDRMGGSLSGGSLWSWIKDKAVPWVRKIWSVIQPLVSRVADVAIPAAATALGAPQGAIPARAALKQLVGIGLKKGSPEMKAKMAALRAKRKAGGSFRVP